MGEIDKSQADYVYNYFFDLMAFSFVRIFPDIDNSLCQQIMDCADPKADIIRPFLETQTTLLQSDFAHSAKSNLSSGFGLWAKKKAKPDSEIGQILAKKWRMYMKLDYGIEKSHNHSQHERRIALHDILYLESARKISELSEQLENSALVPE